MEYEVKQLLNPNLYSDIFSITDGSTDFSRFNGKTVLITGAGQLLGIYIASAFLINNDINSSKTRIIAADASEDIFRKYGKLTNRTDIDFIVSRDYSALTGVKSDFVIHTENLSALDAEPAIVNLLTHIRNSESRAVINTYSDIYGDVFNGKDKISEDDMGYVNPAKPGSRSIQTQRMAESLAVWLCETEGLNITLSRSALIYGATEFNGESKHIELISKAMRGHNLVINPDDGIPQSYCYITDAAEGILTVLLNGKPGGIYNVSSNYIASTSFLAQSCVNIFSDKDLKLITKGTLKPTSPISPTIRVLDNAKLVSLGFSPKVSIGKGILRIAKILSEVK